MTSSASNISSDSSSAPASGRRPPRTSTIVWGLLITAVGALLLAWQLTAIKLDPLAVLLGLTLGAGAALLIGGAVSALGSRGKRGGKG